ncbi:MAG: hypothetical protein ACYS0D_11900, partial [Planctomycetota bacterium]
MRLKDRTVSRILAGTALGCIAVMASAAHGQRVITSADGLWTATVDDFGQVVNLVTPDQPTVDNVFETLVFEASPHNGLLSRRMETFYTVSQVIDAPDHTFTRLEKNQDFLSIEIDNYMISGPTGGVRVEIRLINKGPTSTAAKLFYYCDLEISGTFLDDEATTVIDPGSGGVLALEQFDAPPADPAKPLWFGGCPVYKSWEIDNYAFLLNRLDGGINQLASADNSAPGAGDHTLALSGDEEPLLPGGAIALYAAIGGPGINGCPQLPWCPCDCAPVVRDKVVSVLDFLMLLSQWGGPGSCDCAQPPNGVVDILDFLAILGAWGPCPTPNNDECVNQERIDKTDPVGTTAVHFDMYGATPSPEPYKCLADNPIHKDSWYCLTNVTGQTVGVTITTSVQLFIEVNDGCGCPPGPVLACGEGPIGTDQFVMEDGQQVLIRLIDWLDLPNDELKGTMFITNKEIPQEVNFFDDLGLFLEEIQNQGKFSKGSWAFKP